MNLAIQIIGWFFIVAGAAVGIVITIEPLIYTSTPDQPYSPLWDIALDRGVAICIVLGFAFTFFRKHGLDAEGAGGAITWDRLSDNALFYGFLFIGILFFWDLGAQFNWDTFSPGSEGIYGAAWIVIYALFAPLAITLGLRMQNVARYRMLISNYIGVLRKYAVFRGRATRSEYWWFQLADFIVYIALVGLLIWGVALNTGEIPITGLLLVVYAIGTLLPNLAVCVRRFHDGGYSGWMILLGLIPAIGWIIVLIFMVLPSEQRDNKHGQDPRGAVA